MIFIVILLVLSFHIFPGGVGDGFRGGIAPKLGDAVCACVRVHARVRKLPYAGAC